jgi:hypothetical protein
MVHIQLGKPTHNGGAKSFDGKLRNKRVNASRFWNCSTPRKIPARKMEYNSCRPHRSLGYLSLDDFTQQWRFVSLSYDLCRAENRPHPVNPDGLRFALSLTRLLPAKRSLFKRAEQKNMDYDFRCRTGRKSGVRSWTRESKKIGVFTIGSLGFGRKDQGRREHHDFRLAPANAGESLTYETG